MRSGLKVRYAIIEDPNSIFGMVGRCGSGYNTIWDDWSPQGREKREKINDEWYERYDAITNHYSKLEESILKEGMRNPLVITCGYPLIRRVRNLPNEMRSAKPEDLLLLEGYDGGSRLWVAQKHNIPIPCIINDRTGRFANCEELKTKEQILAKYQDKPQFFSLSSSGVSCTKIQHAHLDNEYVEPEKQAEQIIPLWVELMLKHGYRPNVRAQHRKYLTDAQQARFGYKRDNPQNFKERRLAKKSSTPPKRATDNAITLKPKPKIYNDVMAGGAAIKNILQIGLDDGSMFIRLFKDNYKELQSTWFYTLGGDPFNKFTNNGEKVQFYQSIKRTRDACINSGISSTSVIDCTNNEWVNRVGETIFDCVIIRRGKVVPEINYYLDTLLDRVNSNSRIIIESPPTVDLELSGYNIAKKNEYVLVLKKKTAQEITPEDSARVEDNDPILGELSKIDASKWDHTAYIVAGGPSLKEFDWSKLGEDKFIVAINQSHKVLPNAQIVYFTDAHYWRPEKKSLLAHRGMLVRGVLNPKREETHPRVTLMHLTGPTGFETRPGKLKHGSNSTYAAVNMLAAHLGFKKIYLLGVDMKWAEPNKNSATHWHEGYKRRTPETTYRRMIKNYTHLEKPLQEMGVEVINVVNPDCPSALKSFKQKTLSEVFD